MVRPRPRPIHRIPARAPLPARRVEREHVAYRAGMEDRLRHRYGLSRRKRMQDRRVRPRPDLFLIEAAFLHEDVADAQDKAHLTARQAGLLARAAGAKRTIPFHFSQKHFDDGQRLRDEAEQAFLHGAKGARQCHRRSQYTRFKPRCPDRTTTSPVGLTWWRRRSSSRSKPIRVPALMTL